MNTRSESTILDFYPRRRESPTFPDGSSPPPSGFRTSCCPRPFYSRLHPAKLDILWISDASAKYLTAEIIYIE